MRCAKESCGEMIISSYAGVSGYIDFSNRQLTPTSPTQKDVIGDTEGHIKLLNSISANIMDHMSCLAKVNISMLNVD